MPKILYGISPIGLGHATRSLVIIKNLEKAGVEVKVFSGGEAAEFLRGEGLEVAGIVEDTPPSVSGGRMTGASLWYLRSWRGHRRTLPKTRELLERTNPELVVCDEEFSGVVVAQERGKKSVFISDELELGFAKGWLAGRIEGRVYRWYRRLQESVDLLIIPEEGNDSGNRRYVGPIVRDQDRDPASVRQKHRLPAGGKMILLSLSGSGLGNYLIGPAVKALHAVSLPGAFLVITGNSKDRANPPGVYDLGFVPDNQDLVAAADLVISNAGKSTMDEAAVSGTPIIAIPIKNHAEQERNAAALGYSFDDIRRLDRLIAEKIERRSLPVPNSGADRASRLILSMSG